MCPSLISVKKNYILKECLNLWHFCLCSFVCLSVFMSQILPQPTSVSHTPLFPFQGLWSLLKIACLGRGCVLGLACQDTCTEATYFVPFQHHKCSHTKHEFPSSSSRKTSHFKDSYWTPKVASLYYYYWTQQQQQK